MRRPEDVVTIARRARELRFSSTVGLLHDGTGRVSPFGSREAAIYEEGRLIDHRQRKHSRKSHGCHRAIR